MEAYLELEKYGKNEPWVAMIHGVSSRFGWHREFLEKKKDYANSNKRGTRGIAFCYTLPALNVFEVCKPLNYHKKQRSFIVTSDNGTMKDIEENEVERWIVMASVVRLGMRPSVIASGCSALTSYPPLDNVLPLPSIISPEFTSVIPEEKIPVVCSIS